MIVTIKSYATEQVSLRNPATEEVIFLSPSEKCDVDEKFMLQADPRVRIIKRHKEKLETVVAPPPPPPPAPAPAAVTKPVSPAPQQAPAAPAPLAETAKEKPSSGSL